MGISVTDALRGGAEKLARPNGLAVLGAFVAIGIANAVAIQSIFLAGINRALRRAGVEWADAVDAAPGTLAAQLQMIIEPSQLFPAALDVSIPVAVGLWLLVALLAEVCRVVGIRVFASDTGGMPDGLVGGIVFAVLNSLVASFITLVLVMLGGVLLVIPGIIIALLLEFVRHEVVLGDANAFEALGNSYGHVKSNLLAVFVLVTVLFVAILLAGFLAGSIASGAPLPLVPSFVPAIVTAIPTVYMLAVMTDAYQQAVADEVGGSAPSGSETAGDADGTPA